MSRHSENFARHRRDAGLLEKPRAELEAVHAERRDAREGVEGSRRSDGLEAIDFVEPRDDHVAAAAVLLHHRLDVGARVREGFDDASLRERVGAGREVLVALVHVLAHRRRRDYPADAPSGHRPRLRRRRDGHGALVHSGQARDADVLAVVEELLVAFIGYHPDVVLYSEGRDLFEILAR